MACGISKSKTFDWGGYRSDGLTQAQLGSDYGHSSLNSSSHYLCRKYGMSESTLYNRKAKFGGMGVSDDNRLKALENENTKLKKLLAETMLDASSLRELLAKSGRVCRSARRRRAPAGQLWFVGTAGLFLLIREAGNSSLRWSKEGAQRT
jgi:putative transposase